MSTGELVPTTCSTALARCIAFFRLRHVNYGDLQNKGCVITISMLDSFSTNRFKAAKCKTLLKLTIPRIKLLRNRREIQLKQMRRDIAKLLENGQEATARIRVEHIIREEKMMAAQEIVELFSELIAVRLPIIESQREYPLDLKEAISSLCFAAPRCADLPELQQVQMLFAAKYGKEFDAAATELMPECGVNRQLVELLSVRAPDPEVKLKLLTDIAAEHELDWDPSASEIELIKPHEDLLFVSGSQLPLPEEKHDESLYAASKQSPTEESDSDDGFEKIDFPEIPKTSVRPNVGTVSAPEMLPFPEVEFESTSGDDTNEETLAHEGLEEISPVSKEIEPGIVHRNEMKKISSEKQSRSTNFSPGLDVASKQFVPFVSPPPSSTAFQEREGEMLCSQTLPRTKSEVDEDLQDVLAAAQADAESAERAAAAARSAASLAQVKISKLGKQRSDESPDFGSENPFHLNTCEAETIDKPQISRNDPSGENIVGATDFSPQLSSLPSFDDHKVEYDSSFSSYYDDKVEFDSSQLRNDFPGLNLDPHLPQRLPSIDDDFFSYPNLFKRQDSNIEPSTHPSEDSSHLTK